MSADYFLAIDQGTTGSTSMVLSLGSELSIIGQATVDFPQIYPQPGWVEHSQEAIWESCVSAMKKALQIASAKDSQFNPKQLAGIGITNQRETVCTFDRKTGKALANAIVWQCKRSAGICQDLKKAGLEASVREKTGLVLDPYFSGSKMRWLMANNADIARSVQAGDAVFGTIDAFVLHRLTGSKSFKTEASNASRTLLFNLRTGDYDDSLLDMFGVPRRALPELQDSASRFGVTSGLGFLPDGIPITGVLGDQQAALAGQTCYEPGESKCTYGTGVFLLLNTGTEAKLSTSGMLTTVAWSLEGKRTFAFEGSGFIAGAAVQFLRDQMKFIERSAQVERLAETGHAAPDMFFVPALVGLGAPWWDPDARGSFFGLTRGTSQADFARAALEGISLQVCDLLEAMGRDLGKSLATLRVDGGASANNLLMQLQANHSGLPVDRPSVLETTALGAGLFAVLGSGARKSLAELKNLRRSERVFSPTPASHDERPRIMQQWHRAVTATRYFAHGQVF